MAAVWGYKENGPESWGSIFPEACGLHQSPVDIDTSKVKYDPALTENPLVISYRPEPALKLSNTGHSVKADCTQESILTGGPLDNNVYKLCQFHLHWGAEDSRGSEHKINGEVYSAELHLVHWNSTSYSSFNDAVNKNDGLAVLCMFIKIGSTHPGFEALSCQLQNATCKGSQCNLCDTFDPTCLLPGNTKRYWTYPGSLTTPPCYESVQFILFEEALEFSSEQLASLRSLKCGDDDSSECMVDNFRPTFDLNDRTVLASFKQ